MLKSVLHKLKNRYIDLAWDDSELVCIQEQGRSEGKLVGGGKSQNSQQIEFLARFSQQNAQIPNKSTFRRRFSQQISIFRGQWVGAPHKIAPVLRDKPKGKDLIIDVLDPQTRNGLWWIRVLI